MDFFVSFWGTRGSIPTPGKRTQKYGGNTSCVELRIDGTLFICDAGSGLNPLGLELMSNSTGPIVGHLFFSHTHWDHIQGFPFFTPAYASDNTFYVYGTCPNDRRFFDLLSGQMKSDYFPVDFSELGAQILPRELEEGGSDIEGVRIACLEQPHPGRSWAYCFEKEGRKVVYATDSELDLVLENKEESTQDPECLRIIPQRFVQAFADADLLIADGQYDDREYLQKVGWGHPRATTIVDLAIQARAKQLALFHHDPLQSDQVLEEKLTHCRERAKRLGTGLQVFAAREGVELRIV